MKYCLFLLALAACGNSSLVIIGDSISLEYEPFVRTAGLSVAHSPGNSKNTQWTIDHLDEWVNSADQILWNNGLWDCNEGFENWFTTPEQYEENLRTLAPRMKAKGQVMFALTTEIPPGNTEGRVTGCELERNAIAQDVMEEFNIPICDLHTASVALREFHTTPRDVHFTEEGSKLLAQEVLKCLIDQPK